MTSPRYAVSSVQRRKRRTLVVLAGAAAIVLVLIVAAVIIGGFIGGRVGVERPVGQSQFSVVYPTTAASVPESDSEERGVLQESDPGQRDAESSPADGEDERDGSAEIRESAASTPIPGTSDLQLLLDSAVTGATNKFGGTAAVSISSPQESFTAGDDTAYPAWSTIKVPIAIAALRQNPSQLANATAAITRSDNASAEAMFAALPAGAADSVMSEAGVGVPINTVKLRPEYSTFGQTALTTSQEALLASNLRCVADSADVVSLMGQVIGEQAYGLGTLPGARFKGGWGPSDTGGYQVRQLGLVAGPRGDVAIAMTAIPGSGAYGDGQAMLSSMAAALGAEIARFPTSAC